MRLCECVSCAVWFGLVWFARATRGGLWLLAVGISRAARRETTGAFLRLRACVRAHAKPGPLIVKIVTGREPVHGDVVEMRCAGEWEHGS